MALPYLPHLPQRSLELAQACRASKEVLVEGQGLPVATGEPWAPRCGCLLHGEGEPEQTPPPSSPLLLEPGEGRTRNEEETKAPRLNNAGICYLS